MYEKFLHQINMHLVVMDHSAIKKLVSNADAWSYAHRFGDCISDKERQKLIDAKFWKLCDL